MVKIMTATQRKTYQYPHIIVNIHVCVNFRTFKGEGRGLNVFIATYRLLILLIKISILSIFHCCSTAFNFHNNKYFPTTYSTSRHDNIFFFRVFTQRCCCLWTFQNISFIRSLRALSLPMKTEFGIVVWNDEKKKIAVRSE